MKLNIAHLYPDLLNLYGDKGNIVSMQKRAQWRGIEVEVTEYKLEDNIDFANTDIIFVGGGPNREQQLVCNRLLEQKDDIKTYVENNGVLVAICGGYQILGHYYVSDGEKIDGLGIVDMYTEGGETRFTDNVIIRTDFLERPVVGFENHSGRTYINANSPFGKIVYGNGNNCEDKTEGVMYKNVIGTYLHGPLLPKNPHLCDYIIKKALQNKYGDVVLKDLDDAAELAANDYIINRFGN